MQRSLLSNFTVRSRAFSSKVNGVRGHASYDLPLPKAKNVRSKPSKLDYEATLALDKGRDQWSRDEVTDAIKKHTIYTWNPSAAVDPHVIGRAEGVYFYDKTGNRFLDFNSQAMCSNLGHTVPKEVLEEVNAQMESVPYGYPCVTVTEVKARLSKLLTGVFPEELGHFFYPMGGSEANESAMRIARLFTGRHKIFSRYRSYHGASTGSMSLTGDPRRWPSEPKVPGVIHFHDPWPYTYDWGQTEEEITNQNLRHLHEQILYEGPNNVAAIFIESVTGTNGILIPPKGYLEGLRGLCDEYGILLVCDEVMAGFGRTGKMFGFQHSDPEIIPDIVCAAKGINGGFLPLGCVAMHDRIAEHFQSNSISTGSTYNSHATVLASAVGAMKFFLKNRVLDNVQAMEPIFLSLLGEMADKHPSVKSARGIGLFGTIDLQKDEAGTPFSGFGGVPASPTIAKMKKHMQENGLFTLYRWNNFFTNPPLVINEEELREGFAIIDKTLEISDEAFANKSE